MRPRHALALALLACADAGRAGPTPQAFDMHFGRRIQLACIAQDPAYEQSVFGKLTAKASTFESWSPFEREPFSRCLNQRRFLDRSLCDDVTAVPVDGNRPDTLAALDAALHRHDAVLAAADDILSLQDEAWAAPARFVCPAKLPHHEKTAP
jgi:hypothetical protein